MASPPGSIRAALDALRPERVVDDETPNEELRDLTGMAICEAMPPIAMPWDERPAGGGRTGQVLTVRV
jgi:hypothetical protein